MGIALVAIPLVFSSTHGMPMVMNNIMPNTYQTDYHYGAADLSLSGGSSSDALTLRNLQFGQPSAQIGDSVVPSQHHQSVPTVSHSFANWADWGGNWISDPQCTSHGDERLDAFTVGLDRHVYYRAGHRDPFHHWHKIEGATTQYPPAVAAQKDGSIDVVIHGPDNVIHYARRGANGEWHPFESLHFRSFHRPGLAQWFNHGLFIFAIGTDGQMYKLERRHNEWWHGDARRDWVCLGGSWSGGVVGAHISGEEPKNNVFVLAYDKEGYLHYTRFIVDSPNSKLGNWVDHWIKLHVRGTLAPAVATRPNGFDVAIRAPDGQISVNSYNLHGNEWVGWAHLGFRSHTIPGIAAHPAGRLYLFALDHHHHMHVCHREHERHHFSSWARMGGPYSSSPSALVRRDQVVDVFVLGENHALLHAFRGF